MFKVIQTIWERKECIVFKVIQTIWERKECIVFKVNTDHMGEEGIYCV